MKPHRTERQLTRLSINVHISTLCTAAYTYTPRPVHKTHTKVERTLYMHPRWRSNPIKTPPATYILTYKLHVLYWTFVGIRSLSAIQTWGFVYRATAIIATPDHFKTMWVCLWHSLKLNTSSTRWPYIFVFRGTQRLKKKTRSWSAGL